MLIFSNGVFAIADTPFFSPVEPPKDKPGFGTVIKFAPLPLICDFHNAIMGGVEYRIKGGLASQNEVGLVIPGYSMPNPDFKNMWGVRNRFEIRHYFPSKKKSHLYPAIELVYNDIGYNRERNVPRTFAGSSNEYYQLLEYRIRKKIFAVHFKMGVQFPLHQRMIMDIFGGVGMWQVYLKPNQELPFETEDFSMFFPFITADISTDLACLWD